MLYSREATARPTRGSAQSVSGSVMVTAAPGGLGAAPEAPTHTHSGRRNGLRNPAAIVAGGAGFLGSHLCDRLLAEGYRVYCIDSLYTGRLSNLEHLSGEARFSLMELDVRSPLPAVSGVTEIYNLASPASPIHYQSDPVHTVTTNVMGTLNLIELAATLGARFLQASTSEVYGDPEIHPQPESYRGCVSPTGPRACYDEGKRVAESICYDFLRLKHVDVRVTRIFNTYGPRMRADDGRIVSNLITQALQGEPLTIYGTGTQTRSFCYVSDLIEGMRRLASLAQPPRTPVNLGNPEEFTVLELAGVVMRLTHRNASILYKPLPQDDPQRRRPDIRLAARLLNWQPCVPLEEGLKSTIDWFAQNDDVPHKLVVEPRDPRMARPVLSVSGALAIRGVEP